MSWLVKTVSKQLASLNQPIILVFRVAILHYVTCVPRNRAVELISSNKSTV